MLKAVVVFVATLAVLAPICVLGGYAVGQGIAAYVYSGLPAEPYKQDRELFAGVYGILFIGGFAYAVAAAFALYRLVRAILASRVAKKKAGVSAGLPDR